MADPIIAAPQPFDDADLIRITDALIGADLSGRAVADLEILITITQHATDRLLNELEARGAIAIEDGGPVIPYVADHVVDTILTRCDA
ncbi:hypothetical protein KPL78_19105 [Roseomonas sp. HJA6]|uniref:MarR family transcriptional regulator n=1 Tax=Roseomonas alba TaxID=2846776 RepID=A0ABS7AE16_9PROT|nr:hypothetical protein [Neoroseomonas alba]MBW6399977.1 hypothetical protein [Neoroseomonas alba]